MFYGRRAGRRGRGISVVDSVRNAADPPPLVAGCRYARCAGMIWFVRRKDRPRLMRMLCMSTSSVRRVLFILPLVLPVSWYSSNTSHVLWLVRIIVPDKLVKLPARTTFSELGNDEH